MPLRFPFHSYGRMTLDGQVEHVAGAASRLALGERIELPRGLCHFDVLRLSADLAKSVKAVRAAELAARTRSPFKKAGVRLVWGRTVVCAWTWPLDRIPDSVSPDAVLIPETLRHDPLDGLHLRRCREGFEGQLWREGDLVASRWWPHHPGLNDFQSFARGAGAAAPVDPPTATDPQFRPPPDPPNRMFSLFKALKPRDAVAAIILLGGVPLGFLGAKSAVVSIRAAELGARASALEAVAMDAVSARAQYLASRQKLELYQPFITGGEALESLAVFSEAASLFEARLQSYTYRDGRIDILIELPEAVTPVQLVQTLEQSPILADVRFETTNQPTVSRVTATIESEFE